MLNASTNQPRKKTVLASNYLEEPSRQELKEHFKNESYIRLPQFLDQTKFEEIEAEVKRLHEIAIDRDFIMPGVNTPRKMKTLGGQRIMSESPLVYSLYQETEIWRFLEDVTGAPVFRCKHSNEFLVANFLEGVGSTHGFHLDDPAYALVLFFEVPLPGEGGRVELIPHWKEKCAFLGKDPDHDVEPTVKLCQQRGWVKTFSLEKGDAYLLRADTALHRVTSLLNESARRYVINMAFEAMETTRYGDSADLLYRDIQAEVI